MDYEVVYSSRTGNTQKVAMEIFESLPGISKDIRNVTEPARDQADLYFVGFWNNKGTCSSEIMDFLSGLRGCRVALFGTCGLGRGNEYFERVANQVSVFLSEDCEYMGSFLCTGKMQPRVLEKYKILLDKEDSPQIRSMIQIYEDAMLHPDGADLKAAREFVRRILKN